MTFAEYCQENKISKSMAAELSEKNNRHYKQAYEDFKRPAYYSTVAEQKGESHENIENT